MGLSVHISKKSTIDLKKSNGMRSDGILVLGNAHVYCTDDNLINIFKAVSQFLEEKKIHPVSLHDCNRNIRNALDKKNSKELVRQITIRKINYETIKTKK